MTETTRDLDASLMKRKGCLRFGCLAGLGCLLLAYAGLAIWSHSTTRDVEERWARLVEITDPSRGRHDSPREEELSEAQNLASAEFHSEWRHRWTDDARGPWAGERARRLLEALEENPGIWISAVDWTLREPVEYAFELALGFDDLTPRQFELLHDFARRWQARGDTWAFWQRMRRLEMLLDRAEGDEAFRTVLRTKPAPRPSEAFDALCREAVLQHEETAHNLDHGSASGTRPPERTRKLHELLLLVLLERSLDLEDLEDEPASWRGPKRRWESGILLVHAATWLNLKKLQVRAVAPGVDWRIFPPELGPEWAGFLDRWNEVVGP